MQALKQYIEQYTLLNNEDWLLISSKFEQTTVKANSYLLQEGKVCRHLYFLEAGLLRYFITKDGKEINKFFTVAPYCCTSQVSFTSGLPATENIQALEDSVVWRINLQSANELLALTSWNTFIRKLIQQVQSYTENILQELQTSTAETRYKKMLESNPALLQRVPLKHLASYFGIAAPSLSRIRKKK